MMKLQFLCAGHREWLANSPGSAINCWSNGMETGKVLCDDFRWNEALPHVGCAYEASEIILSMIYIDRHNAIRFFTSSVFFLAKLLIEVNSYDEARLVYGSARDRLQRELLSNHNEKAYIAEQMAFIDNKLKGLAIPSTASTSHALLDSEPLSSNKLSSSKLHSSKLNSAKLISKQSSPAQVSGVLH